MSRFALAAAFILLPLALQAEQGRSRHIPGVYTNEQIEEDADTSRQPDKKDFFTLVQHLQDLITDKNTKEEKLPGLDNFMDMTQERMIRDRGSDKPRFEILTNAHQGRDKLRDAYDALRRGITPLLEAQKILLETYAALEAVVEQQQGQMEAVAPVAQEMSQTTQAMNADAEPPESTGQEVQTQPLQAIEPLTPRLEPLDPRLEEATRLIQEAKGHIETAKNLHYIINTFAQRAQDLDNKSLDALSKSQTTERSRDVPKEDSSFYQINNTNGWLDKAAEKGKKVQEMMDKLVDPKEGKLRKALESAKKADGSIQKAKQAGEKGGEQVNQAHQQISQDIKEQWTQMEQMPDGPEKDELKAKLKDQAAKAKSGADQASQAMAEKTEKAGKDFEQSQKKKDQARKDVEKIFKELGEGDPNDLGDIMDYQIVAPAPREGNKAESGRANSGGNVKSKKMKYPDILTRPNESVRDEFGEAHYGQGL